MKWNIKSKISFDKFNQITKDLDDLFSDYVEKTETGYWTQTDIFYNGNCLDTYGRTEAVYLGDTEEDAKREYKLFVVELNSEEL